MATAPWPTSRAAADDPAAAYDFLRARLQELNAAADKDMQEIDKVIDLLAKAQRAVKASHGLKGNNPIED